MIKRCHICVELLKYIVVSYAATKSHVSLIDLVSAGVYVNVHGKCTTKGYENMTNLAFAWNHVDVTDIAQRCNHSAQADIK